MNPIPIGDSPRYTEEDYDRHLNDECGNLLIHGQKFYAATILRELARAMYDRGFAAFQRYASPLQWKCSVCGKIKSKKHDAAECCTESGEILF